MLRNIIRKRRGIRKGKRRAREAERKEREDKTH